MAFDPPPNPSDIAGRPRHPWREAARNSVFTLVAVGAAGVAHLFRVERSFGFGVIVVAWWAWPVVAAFAVGVCFAHGATCVAVGRAAAHKLFGLLLVGVLLALVLWARHVGDGALR
jgi:F0F1-type ATP synthase membrane subunit c/vacuolar-type H+-ATPase subunit K